MTQNPSYPERRRVVTPVGDVSRTEQHHAQGANINTIMAKYKKTGLIPQFVGAAYGDFTGVTDYHTAIELVRQSQLEFERLPANIRRYFNDDPGQLLDFVADDANRAKAIELGLIPCVPKKEEVEPPKAPADDGAQNS